MSVEDVISIISILLGSGGFIAFIKARSETRNANKAADIEGLSKTIEVLQFSYNELQSTYIDAIKECEERNNELFKKVEKLELSYKEQEKEKMILYDRIRELEKKLEKANKRIECLELESIKKDAEITELRKENELLQGQYKGLRVK